MQILLVNFFNQLPAPTYAQNMRTKLDYCWIF